MDKNREPTIMENHMEKTHEMESRVDGNDEMDKNRQITIMENHTEKTNEM